MINMESMNKPSGNKYKLSGNVVYRAFVNIVYEKTNGKKRKKIEAEPVYVPIAVKENFFVIIYGIHSVQRGHVGGDQTFKFCQSRWYVSQICQSVCNM